MRVRLRRLREPRYLIGTVVGALYLYLVFFRRGARPRRAAPGGAGSILRVAGPIQFVGSVALLIFTALMWVIPGPRRALEFTRAEVQFLFQAPVSRRQLLHYKLLRSQIGALVGSVFTTLVFRPPTISGSWRFLVGTWLLFTIINLHMIGVSFSRESLARHGRSGITRQWIPITLVLAALGTLAGTVIGHWSELTQTSTSGAVFEILQRLGNSGAAWLVLWPFRTLMSVPLAQSAAEFWIALGGALVLLVLNYMWVIRADTAFEEAAADHAEKQATARAVARLPAVRSRVAPFELALQGPVEIAILWKNLIMLGRYASPRLVLRALPLVVIGTVVLRGTAGSGGLTTMAAVLCVFAAGMTMLMGPQMLRNDLRQDLRSLPLLRLWPIRGAALLRGELLAPGAVLTSLAWLFILGAALLAGRLPARLTSSAEAAILNRVSYTTAILLLAPALIVTQLVVHNAAAVLFPAWVTAGGSRARGIDAMGQRLLMFAGIVVALAIMVAPGVLVAVIIAAAVYWLSGVTLIVLPTLAGVAIVAAECWLVVEALGRVLDRTDVAAIDAAE